MLELTKFIFRHVEEALFPHICVCGKWGVVLCDDCKKKLIVKKTEVCPLCKKISKYGKTCNACRYKSNLTGVMVAGDHSGVLKELIWKLKYGPVKDVSSPLANILINKYGDFLQNKRPVITFVPTSKSRMALRGYNQAEEIAKILAKSAGLEAISLMKRPKDTLHQVGLTRRERIVNAKGTIEFSSLGAITNKRVVIIDDVYTTGATLEECAKVLRANGYREIWGMVLSRD